MYIKRITLLMASCHTYGGNAKLKHVLKCFSGLWPEQSAIYMYKDRVLKECSVRASFYNLRKEKQNREQISQYLRTC